MNALTCVEVSAIKDPRWKTRPQKVKRKRLELWDGFHRLEENRQLAFLRSAGKRPGKRL